jgi:hypothetical protein
VTTKPCLPGLPPYVIELVLTRVRDVLTVRTDV